MSMPMPREFIVSIGMLINTVQICISISSSSTSSEPHYVLVKMVGISDADKAGVVGAVLETQQKLTEHTLAVFAKIIDTVATMHSGWSYYVYAASS